MIPEYLQEIKPLLDRLALTKLKMQQLGFKPYKFVHREISQLKELESNLTDELIEKLITMKIIDVTIIEKK